MTVYLKDPITKVCHLPEDENSLEDSVCDVYVTALSEVHLDEEPDNLCDVCQKVSDGEKVSVTSIYADRFRNSVLNDAQDFLDNLDDHFKDKVIDDYNQEYLLSFAVYWVSNDEVFELQKKLEPDLSELLETESMYRQLFCW